ncbi:histidine phosphatase family protein [Hydrogenoanaerobacterium sp.]|uniref:histidine phosphatase family protein n=1 Tax=Hydrogenoanaerobacterium sp. TaxID=2953763 RepID=UPI00289C8216|nr:histidine phosphatase family protein [Hydrogenoanaerobacterium sp.]
MNTRVYLVRHAEAAGNVAKTFQGHSDCEVTEKGHKQLACLAERFKDVEYAAIYSSPLLRARQTADAANRYHGLEVQLDAGLIEINGGDIEGMSWDEIPVKYPGQQEAWDNAPHEYWAPNGEQMVEVYERITVAVNRIVRENAGKTIVLVSHGCSIRNYLCYAYGWDIKRLRDVMWEENTSVCCIDYTGSDFHPTVIYQNDASHLPTELCTLAHQSWWKTTITEDTK